MPAFPRLPLHLPPRALRVLWLLLPVLGAALAYAPALGGGFTGDDWTILALARHGTSPWTYYVGDHTLAYSYRPHGMVTWWLAARAFGADPAGHHALALALHAGNALLLLLLARRYGAALSTAAIAALLLAVHPAAIGTAVWLSDRYDLLALGGALATLLALHHAAQRGRGGIALLVAAALLAAGSKETAFAVAGAGLVWIAVAAPPRRWLMAAALLAPFALALLMRLLVFGGSGLGRLGEHAGSPLQHLGGVWLWLRHLPALLAGEPAWIAALALAALVLLHGAGRGRASAWTRERSAALLAALALALLPGLLQAPITRLALAGEAPLASITNARFYYLALGGVLLVAAVLARQRAGVGSAKAPPVVVARLRALLAGAIALALAAAFAWQSHALARYWRDDTAAPQRLAVNAGAVAATRATAARGLPCRVGLLDAGGASPDFPRFADSLVKAQLPPGAAALDCVVGGGQASWLVLTAQALPPGQAPVARSEGALHRPQAVLGMTAYYPDEPVRQASRAVWRWDGVRFREVR